MGPKQNTFSSFASAKQSTHGSHSCVEFISCCSSSYGYNFIVCDIVFSAMFLMQIANLVSKEYLERGLEAFQLCQSQSCGFGGLRNLSVT